MSCELPLPGNADHQASLNLLVSLYKNDEGVAAVYVFGSLGKGTWDAHSDLDLAVLLHDNVQVSLSVELERVRGAFAEHGNSPLFVEMADDECFFVLPSLACVAIRYYKLASTSSYVLEGCRVLWGTLDVETLREAARANVSPKPPLNQELHRALWLALAVDTALQRRQFWPALQALERMQGALLGIFVISRGATRVHRVFEAEAGAPMKALFGRALPQYFPDATTRSVDSVGDSLMALLDLLEHHLADLSNHQLVLDAGERKVIAGLRRRCAARRNDFG